MYRVYFLSLMQKSSQDELKQQLAKVFEEKHKSELASKVNYQYLIEGGWLWEISHPQPKFPPSSIIGSVI